MINFDKYYFDHGCGTPYERNEAWMNLFGNIAGHVIKDIHPASVLDAGCALGFLVEILRKNGIESYGVDISEYAIQQVHPDIRPYCWVGTITDAFPRRYDLIVTIEVLEHISKDQAEAAIRNLCSFSDDILFSSTPFDYKEITHFNVQPPEYWAEQFARNGFYRDVDFDASFITPWAVRYRRSNEPIHRIVRAYERQFALLFKETSDLRALNYEMRLQSSAYEEQIKRIGEQNEEQLKRIAEQNEEQLRNIGEQIRGLKTELSEMRNSRSWRFLNRVQQIRYKIAPQNSRRDKIIIRLLHILK